MGLRLGLEALGGIVGFSGGGRFGGRGFGGGWKVGGTSTYMYMVD